MNKELPPYVGATGKLQKMFIKIKEASVPPRFTHDFLSTKLNLGSSGSMRAMIPFLKRLGLLGTDGVPTSLYQKFRNPDIAVSGVAIAEAMQQGYGLLYESNEYFHKLEKSKLKDFLIEVTGLEGSSSTIRSLTGTIEVLKEFANFQGTVSDKQGEEQAVITPIIARKKTNSQKDFNIAYTINLNLPETSDSAVFDAIFKSLRDNLLTDETE